MNAIKITELMQAISENIGKNEECKERILDYFYTLTSLKHIILQLPYKEQEIAVKAIMEFQDKITRLILENFSNLSKDQLDRIEFYRMMLKVVN